MTAPTLDGVAVERFCRARAELMKHPLTAAIYVGLADRIRRGDFDAGGCGCCPACTAGAGS